MDKQAILSASATLIKLFENFKSTPYQDQRGIWTVGYGTINYNGKAVTQNYPENLSEQEATSLLIAYLQTQAFPTLEKLLPANTPVKDWVCWLSAVYNCGAGIANSNAMKQYLNKNYGNLADIARPEANTFASEFASSSGWVKADGKVAIGLQKRRICELLYFFFGDKLDAKAVYGAVF